MPPRKLSEVLLEFAKPLLDELDDAESCERAIELVALSWNLSLLDERERWRILHDFAADMGQRDALVQQQTEQMVRELVERKKALYPEDRRMVVDFKLISLPDTWRLLVVSALVK